MHGNWKLSGEMFVHAVSRWQPSPLSYVKHSVHISRRSSLTTYSRAPLYSFNVWFITFIIFYIGSSPTFLSRATLPCRAEGKNSLLECRLAALQFKNLLSCTVLANESGQPLNKNCQFLFGFIGKCGDLAGRQKCLPCGSSYSFRPLVISPGWRWCFATWTRRTFYSFVHKSYIFSWIEVELMVHAF